MFVSVCVCICLYVLNTVLLNFKNNLLSRYLPFSLDLFAVSRSPAWLKSLSGCRCGMAVFTLRDNFMTCGKECNASIPPLQYEMKDMKDMKGTSLTVLLMRVQSSWMQRNHLHYTGCCWRGHHSPCWSPIEFYCSRVLCHYFIKSFKPAHSCIFNGISYK